MTQDVHHQPLNDGEYEDDVSWNEITNDDTRQQELEEQEVVPFRDYSCGYACLLVTLAICILVLLGSMFNQDINADYDKFGVCTMIGPRNTNMIYSPRFPRNETVPSPAEKLAFLIQVTGNIWVIDEYADNFHEGPCQLANERSPEHRAANWLVNKNHPTVAKDDLLERFALADIYFHLGGPHWHSSTNWLSSKSVCEWDKITCCRHEDVELGICDKDAIGKVISLDLAYNNLQGHLTEAFVLLTELRYVDLSNNKIGGEFWGFAFGQMPWIRSVELHNNRLTGSIPESLYQYDETHLGTDERENLEMEQICSSQSQLCCVLDRDGSTLWQRLHWTCSVEILPVHWFSLL